MTSRTVKLNDKLIIEINGKTYPPISFKSFRPTAKNISDFYKAGVRLFDILSSGKANALGTPYSLYGESWIDDYTYDFTPIDNQIELFIKNAPEGYFLVMLQVDTRAWWLKKYPEYEDTFYHLSQMAQDGKWRKAASAYLKAAIRHIEEKYGDRVYGYFILGGTTTEWFSDEDFEAGNAFKLKAYREWLNDPEAVIPEKSELYQPADKVFVDPKEEANLIKYREFHNYTVSDTILYFARAAREVIGHNKLLGIYYGYLFELWGERTWDAGHLDYERVFSSDEIDMYSNPISYAFRGVNNTGATMITDASLKKNGKLLFLESDEETYLVATDSVKGRLSPDKLCRPYHYDTTDNFSDNRDSLRREIMMALGKDAAFWWFDMFEGWYYSEDLMEEISKLVSVYGKMCYSNNVNVSEIAMISDPKSLYYVNKTSEAFLNSLNYQRSELFKIGAPADSFSTADLDYEYMSKYKMLIFLNAVKIDDKARVVIEKLKSEGRLIVFIYAPDYVGDNGYSVKRISDMTGINVEKTDAGKRKIVSDGTIFGSDCEMDTTFKVSDSEAEILGRYEESGEPAFAYKNLGEYSSVYSAKGCIPGKILRKLAKRAGIHIYSDDENVSTYIKKGLLGVYTFEKADTALNVKEDGMYKDMFTETVYESKDGRLFLPKSEGRAKLLLKI